MGGFTAPLFLCCILRMTAKKKANAILMNAPYHGAMPEWVLKASRRKSPKPRRHEEENIQITLCEWLDLHPDITYWATPNSTFIGPMTGAKMWYLAKLKRMGVKKGIPDLSLFFRDGDRLVFCWAELKSEKGVTSKEQKNYMEACEKSGGYSAIVKSLDDLINLLNRAGYFDKYHRSR